MNNPNIYNVDFLRARMEAKYNPPCDVLRHTLTIHDCSDWCLIGVQMPLNTAIMRYDIFQNLVLDTTPCWMRG